MSCLRVCFSMHRRALGRLWVPSVPRSRVGGLQGGGRSDCRQECALYWRPRGGSGAELHALGLDPSAPMELHWRGTVNTCNTLPASSKRAAGIPYYFQVHLKRRVLIWGLDPAVTPTHFIEAVLGSRAGHNAPPPRPRSTLRRMLRRSSPSWPPGGCLLLPTCHPPLAEACGLRLCTG